MARNKKCGICRGKVSDDEIAQCTNIIKCARCLQYYHTSCLDTTPEETGSPDNIDSWLCSFCASKQGKTDRGKRKKADQSPPSSPSDGDECETAQGFSSPELRQIIREEIRNALKDSIVDINAHIDTKLQDLSTKMSDLQESMAFQSEQVTKIEAKTSSHHEQICSLTKENESLRSTISNLGQRVNQMDQVHRASILEIQCVPEHKSENLLSIIKQISTIINFPLKDGDIAHFTRVAKLNKDSSRPRTILVRFINPLLRDSFLAASIKYNKANTKDKLNSSHLGIGGEKKSPVFIVENLSPENKILHAAARAKAKELDYKFVWVRNGKVFMRKTDDSEYVYVRSLETLEKIVK